VDAAPRSATAPTTTSGGGGGGGGGGEGGEGGEGGGAAGGVAGALATPAAEGEPEYYSDYSEVVRGRVRVRAC